MATDYKKKAKEARIKVLDMIHKAGTSHIASNFSVIDIAVVLYENLKPEDKVVWSKGWVAATIYYFLAKQGFIPQEDLEKFGKEEITKEECPVCSIWTPGQVPDFEECHACDGVGWIEKKEIKYLGLVETTTPGIYANAGSMGHGLPIACGMALAKKLKGEPGNIYCIMSDGEMNEGTTWESAMFAAHHKLTNLVVIVDKNKWQAMGKCDEVLNVDPAQAFKGFKWETNAGRIALDGHNFEDIEYAINHPGISYIGLPQPPYFPRALVFDTIKGKGVSFMEDHLLYHYKHVDEENYKLALSELKSDGLSI